jgi:hypothetical protein
MNIKVGVLVWLSFYKILYKSRLGMVVNSCNLSYLGGGDRRIEAIPGKVSVKSYPKKKLKVK